MNHQEGVILTRDVTISVLIPVYCRQDLVGSSIKSAIDQDWNDLEVVVVDNASTDETWDVCRDYAAKDDRVRIFRNKRNLGPVQNWQKCLEEARGQFATLLFSDDVLMPHFLRETIPLLEKQNVGFVFSEAAIGSEPNNAQIYYRWQKKSGLYPSYEFIHHKLLSTRDLPDSPACALFRTSDLRKNLLREIPSPSLLDFKDLGAGNDLMLFLLTALDYASVVFIASPHVFFRAHSGSISINTKGGDLWQRYAQAMVWFAEHHLKNRRICGRLLARIWLKTIFSQRRYVKPSETKEAYTDELIPFSFQDVLVELGGFVKRKINRKVTL